MITKPKVSGGVKGKLVRDLVPAILREAGIECRVKILESKDEYVEALRAKLVEEANEVQMTENGIEFEIADVYEVIDSLIRVLGLDKKYIIQVQDDKRKGRGGFDASYLLIEEDKR